MDMRKFTEGRAGIDQYCPPFCFELAGQSFFFEMDDGYDYELKIIDEKTLEWNFVGKEPAKAEYLCLKGDDTTYLLSFELQGVKQRKTILSLLIRKTGLLRASFPESAIIRGIRILLRRSMSSVRSGAKAWNTGSIPDTALRTT
jgi:hypothetical protein